MQLALFPALYRLFVVAPSVNVSAAFGSMIAAKLSVPSLKNVYFHPSLVALQAGNVRVISAVRVEIATTLWVWSKVVFEATAMCEASSTPTAL